jgi:hypothetical protein
MHECREASQNKAFVCTNIGSIILEHYILTQDITSMITTYI